MNLFFLLSLPILLSACAGSSYTIVTIKQSNDQPAKTIKIEVEDGITGPGRIAKIDKAFELDRYYSNSIKSYQQGINPTTLLQTHAKHWKKKNRYEFTDRINTNAEFYILRIEGTFYKNLTIAAQYRIYETSSLKQKRIINRYKLDSRMATYGEFQQEYSDQDPPVIRN